MANVKLGTKAVGSIVKIKVNGASKDFIVVQQGNPNTSTYDSSCNGTWLLMKDIYTTSTFGNNNSYKDSSIHIPERNVLQPHRQQHPGGY